MTIFQTNQPTRFLIKQQPKLHAQVSQKPVYIRYLSISGVTQSTKQHEAELSTSLAIYS